MRPTPYDMPIRRKPLPGSDAHCSPCSRAFTLTEVLIVIGILVLVLVLAVPAFNYISGARSHEAAANVVSAMLGQARTLAINRGRYVGVFFYLDPATDRTTLCLVSRESGAQEDPDPYDNYKSWENQVNYRASPYRDRVIFFTADLDEGNRGYFKKYRCIMDHLSAPGNSPRPNGPPFGRAGVWEEVVEGDLDLLSGTDFQVLPPGVGVQLVNDPQGVTTADRYVRTGCILFDPQGRMDSINYVISPYSALGRVMGLTAFIAPQQPLRSQFGIAIYDLTTFRAQDGFTEGDAWFVVGSIASPGRYAPDESKEELWLDQNTTLMLVNRNSGTLAKAE